MGHILCITSGLTGILNASFELANRLQQAGHECTLASPIEVREKVEVQGFNFLQLDKINFEPAPNVPENFGKIKRVIHKYQNLKKRRQEALDSLGMATFVHRINQVKPDLIFVDVELHEHIMTLVKSDYKVVLLSQWFSTWKRKGLPPIQDDTIPSIGFKGSKLGLQLAWMKVEFVRSKIFLKKKLSSAWTDRRSILQEYAKKVGFSKKYILQNYWPGPFSYDRLPVICMTTKELDFSHDIRPNMEYIGPMVFASRKDQSNTSEFDFSELKNDGKQLIYCSVSTFKGGDTRFLKKLIAAVENSSNLQIVISLGGLIQKKQLGQIPSNVLVFERVNQLQVLDQADLSINHGGIHTINECLHFKVPMLIYSGKRSDQNGCAARAQYHGVGEMADKDLDSSKDILDKIEKVLSHSLVHQNIEKFHKVNLQYKNEQKLERLVESLIQSDQREVMQLKRAY